MLGVRLAQYPVRETNKCFRGYGFLTLLIGLYLMGDLLSIFPSYTRGVGVVAENRTGC